MLLYRALCHAVADCPMQRAVDHNVIKKTKCLARDIRPLVHAAIVSLIVSAVFDLNKQTFRLLVMRGLSSFTC